MLAYRREKPVCHTIRQPVQAWRGLEQNAPAHTIPLFPWPCPWEKRDGVCSYALQPLPPCVTVAPTMPVRMVSAIVVSLLSGAVAPAYPCAVDQAHAGTTEARVVRRAPGIIRCILNCLLSIVAGFVWRVERGGVNTTNWLRVLDTAESSQVDQRVGHQLHAIMPLLDAFKAE